GRVLAHGDGLVDHGGFRIDYLEIGLELVDELVLGVDGVDHDTRAPVDDRGAEIVTVVDLAAHAGSHDLRPELGITRPAQPLDAPAILDVAGPGNAGSGTESPAGQHRFA